MCNFPAKLICFGKIAVSKFFVCFGTFFILHVPVQHLSAREYSLNLVPIPRVSFRFSSNSFLSPQNRTFVSPKLPKKIRVDGKLNMIQIQMFLFFRTEKSTEKLIPCGNSSKAQVVGQHRFQLENSDE